MFKGILDEASNEDVQKYAICQNNGKILRFTNNTVRNNSFKIIPSNAYNRQWKLLWMSK